MRGVSADGHTGGEAADIFRAGFLISHRSFSSEAITPETSSEALIYSSYADMYFELYLGPPECCKQCSAGDLI